MSSSKARPWSLGYQHVKKKFAHGSHGLTRIEEGRGFKKEDIGPRMHADHADCKRRGLKKKMFFFIRVHPSDH